MANLNNNKGHAEKILRDSLRGRGSWCVVQPARLNGECDVFTIAPMQPDRKTYEALIAALRATGEHSPTRVRIDRKRIRAGLEAHCVERIVIRYCDRAGRQRHVRLVAKQLHGAGTREALVYPALLRSPCHDLSPRPYFIEHWQDERALLLLENVPRSCTWPWRDIAASRAVLERLATLHSTHLEIPSAPEWDYESELQQSAAATLDVLGAMRDSPEASALAKRGMRPVARLVGSLAPRRAELLDFVPYGRAIIHGDVHTGNVILRRGCGPNSVPVLIDWGRARVGSALEDVSSWLQSLGYWEPEARKRHDTLLRDYLRARGSDVRISSDLRAAYWMAGACNALAGALRYHCWRTTSATTVSSRAAAAHAAANWLRVIIRADALCS